MALSRLFLTSVSIVSTPGPLARRMPSSTWAFISSRLMATSAPFTSSRISFRISSSASIMNLNTDLRPLSVTSSFWKPFGAPPGFRYLLGDLNVRLREILRAHFRGGDLEQQVPAIFPAYQKTEVRSLGCCEPEIPQQHSFRQKGCCCNARFSSASSEAFGGASRHSEMGAPDFRQIPTTKSTNSAPSSNLPASTMAGLPQVHCDRSWRRIFIIETRWPGSPRPGGAQVLASISTLALGASGQGPRLPRGQRYLRDVHCSGETRFYRAVRCESQAA